MVLPGEIGTQTDYINAGTVNYKVNVTIDNVDTVDYVVDIKISATPLTIAQPQYVSFASNIVGFTLVIHANVAGLTVTSEVLVVGR